MRLSDIARDVFLTKEDRQIRIMLLAASGSSFGSMLQSGNYIGAAVAATVGSGIVFSSQIGRALGYKNPTPM